VKAEGEERGIIVRAEKRKRTARKPCKLSEKNLGQPEKCSLTRRKWGSAPCHTTPIEPTRGKYASAVALMGLVDTKRRREDNHGRRVWGGGGGFVVNSSKREYGTSWADPPSCHRVSVSQRKKKTWLQHSVCLKKSRHRKGTTYKKHGEGEQFPTKDGVPGGKLSMRKRELAGISQEARQGSL